MMNSVKTRPFTEQKAILSDLFPEIPLKGIETYMLHPRKHFYGTDVLQIVSETYYPKINQFVVDYKISGVDKQKYCFVLGQNPGEDVIGLIEEYNQAMQTDSGDAIEGLREVHANRILSSLWLQIYRNEKTAIHPTDANGVYLIPLMGALIDENTLQVRYRASMNAEHVLPRIITENEHNLNGILDGL